MEPARGPYQPRLGKIQEEPDLPDEGMEWDESVLAEYEILTDEEMKRAIDVDLAAKTTAARGGHSSNTGARNNNSGGRSMSGKSLTVGSRSVGSGRSQNSGRDNGYHGGAGFEKDEHRTLDVQNSEYDFESTTSTYNFMNGSDSGIHNLDASSICSTTNSLSLNPSINESINQSLNGSLNGSLFNLDQIASFSSTLPIEQRVMDFNTVVGRKVFTKAIRQKYMNIYYILSQQRLCGDFIGNESVAAFVMILNALEIRQKELKGNYFKTHSLDAEMSFTDIASVCKENSLSAEVSQVFKSSCLGNFRKAVKLSCKSTNILLLCCYHVEEGTSRVKYSFIGGYFKDNDAVLLVTPSKSRFHARWLPILLMWKILTTDVRTERSDPTRSCAAGYMLLQRNVENPRIAVRINKKALLCFEAPDVSKQDSQDFQRLLRNWSRWLTLPCPLPSTDDVILQGINYVISNINLQKKNLVTFGVANVRRIVDCKVDSFTDIISKTKVYKAVKNQIDSLSTEDLKKLELFSEWICSMTYASSAKCTDRKLKGMNFKKIRKKQGPKNHATKIVYKDNLMLAMCLVFWPYSERRDTNSASLAQSVRSDLSLFPWDTMVRIREQMRFIVAVMQYSFSESAL